MHSHSAEEPEADSPEVHGDTQVVDDIFACLDLPFLGN